VKSNFDDLYGMDSYELMSIREL